MGASREKDQADFDLERFVEIFDEAMTSTNPAVQKAFKNLLMVASIVNSDTRSNPVTKGPLRRLVDDLYHVNRRVSQLEDRIPRESSPREVDYEKIVAMNQALTPAPMMIPAQQLENIKKPNTSRPRLTQSDKNISITMTF